MNPNSDNPTGANPQITPGGSGAIGAPVSPTVIGDFELRREIGRGGMGTVYEAWQRSLNRQVAIKVLAHRVSASPNAVARFEREAQAAAKLHHPNIIPIFAQGSCDDLHYYAMELVSGLDLNQVITKAREQGGADTASSDPQETIGLDPRGRMVSSAAETVATGAGDNPHPDPTDSAVSLAASGSVETSDEHFRTVARQIAGVADALQYAHDQGVIHRDIKPHNLMLGPDGRLRISDFGLARVTEHPGVTATGEFIGSPLYMSPEQIRGGAGDIDHRTDLYSLGATLYEWLTLNPPFPGDSRESVISKVMTTDPVFPRTHNPAIPQDLETICLKALEKNPHRRYQTAAAMRDDLNRFLDRKSIRARRAGMFSRLGRSVVRNPVAAVSAAAIVLIAGLTVALVSFQKEVESQTEVAQTAQEENDRLLDMIFSLTPELAGLSKTAEVVAPVFQGLLKTGRQLGSSDGTAGSGGPDFGAATTVTGIGQRAAKDLYHKRFGQNGEIGELLSEGMEDSAHDALLQALIEPDLQRRRGLLQSVLAADSQNAIAQEMMTAMLASREECPKMLIEADSLVQLNPEDPGTYLWRGLAAMLVGTADFGMDDFDEALSFEGVGAHVPWGMALNGLALVAQARYEEALSFFNDALYLAPDLVFARLGRAMASRSLDRLDAAIADMTHVVALEPDNADVLAVRARDLGAAGQYEEAAQDLSRAMSLSGRTPALIFEWVNFVRSRGSSSVPTKASTPAGPDGSGAVRPVSIEGRSARRRNWSRIGRWILGLNADDRAPEAAGRTFGASMGPMRRLPLFHVR